MNKNDKKNLQDWDRTFVWHPFTQMKDYEQEIPLIISHGQGVYLYDIDGKKYIDGVSSLWTNVHGHRHPKIDQAIKDQINQISHSTLLGLANIPSILLAKKISEFFHCEKKIFYSDSGSESVEIALKMAYQYFQQKHGASQKKKKIAHVSNSYHGDTIGSVSVGGIDLFHKVYQSLLFETVEIPLPQKYYYDEKKEKMSWQEKCFFLLEKKIKDNADTLAAFILEPLIQGAAGMLLYPDGYLKRARKLCNQYEILLIVDEVATGFGRTGTMFAHEQEAIVPDIICIAKGLTGGYLPLAATITSKDVYEAFLGDYKEQKTFFHGHTYTGNPLACAAALANLEIFEKEKVLLHVEKGKEYLEKKLKKFYDLKYVGEIRQKGLMVGIELVKDKAAKTPFAWEEKIGISVSKKAREKGVIIRPLGNVIVLMPPLCISKQELDVLLDVVYESIENL